MLASKKGVHWTAGVGHIQLRLKKALPNMKFYNPEKIKIFILIALYFVFNIYFNIIIFLFLLIKLLNSIKKIILLLR